VSWFDPIEEPWARLGAVVTTAAMGVLMFFFFHPLFGIGLAVGGVICAVLHWSARMDDRRLWRRAEDPPKEEPY
jgi:hypothetical protein